MPLVPETKIADARKQSVLGTHWAWRTTWLVPKTTSSFEFRPAFLEPTSLHVFSIITASSNTLSLFHIFTCRANTLSPVWLPERIQSLHSPTAVKHHKMYKPCKHYFPHYTLSVRLFPASKTTKISSNHRKKQTVEIRSQNA